MGLNDAVNAALAAIEQLPTKDCPKYLAFALSGTGHATSFIIEINISNTQSYQYTGMYIDPLGDSEAKTFKRITLVNENPDDEKTLVSTFKQKINIIDGPKQIQQDDSSCFILSPALISLLCSQSNLKIYSGKNISKQTVPKCGDLRFEQLGKSGLNDKNREQYREPLEKTTKYEIISETQAPILYNELEPLSESELKQIDQEKFKDTIDIILKELDNSQDNLEQLIYGLNYQDITDDKKFYDKFINNKISNLEWRYIQQQLLNKFNQCSKKIGHFKDSGLEEDDGELTSTKSKLPTPTFFKSPDNSNKTTATRNWINTALNIL